MISFVAKLLLASLVFNTASVIAAPVPRAVVPAPGPPAPAPVGPPSRNIADLRSTKGPSTSSRRSISRRQARLVERVPELEQPSLEAHDTPVDVVLEQRSVSHRYPRRVYFEHYEKRSPDPLVIPSSSVVLARDGGRDHCGCTKGLSMRSILSVVRLFGRCACDDTGSAGIPTPTDANGPNSPDTGAASGPTPTDTTGTSTPDANGPEAASPTPVDTPSASSLPTDASGRTPPAVLAGSGGQLNVKLEKTPGPDPSDGPPAPPSDAKPKTTCECSTCNAKPKTPSGAKASDADPKPDDGAKPKVAPSPAPPTAPKPSAVPPPVPTAPKPSAVPSPAPTSSTVPPPAPTVAPAGSAIPRPGAPGFDDTDYLDGFRGLGGIGDPMAGIMDRSHIVDSN